jgi:putative transposase
MPIERPKPTRKRPQALCLDKGYDYNEVRELVEEFVFTAHIRSRGEEAQALNTRRASAPAAGSSSAPTPG